MQQPAQPGGGIVQQTKPQPQPQAQPQQVTAVSATAAESGVSANLTLKFKAGDKAKYSVTTDSENTVRFEGTVPDDPAMKAAATGTSTEIVFTQEIQSVDDKGNAIAKITIDGLKYTSKMKDSVIMDFDSASNKDPNNPLGKLIGKSYSVKITPMGQVSQIMDVENLLTIVEGTSGENSAAKDMISPDFIKDRHGITAIPQLGKEKYQVGSTWSRTKTYPFGELGTKSYERVYKFTGIEESGGRQVAIVDMNAIPALNKNQPSAGRMAKMFDSTEHYKGRLELNLTTGQVESYNEIFTAEWVAVDPDTAPDAPKGPLAVKMGAVRSLSVKKIG